MDLVEPRLAPAGAGLPGPELLAARLLSSLRRRTGNRESFTRKFVAEREKLRALIQTFDAESGARRALIRRPRGLEDSSRYWSAWMTLDHLRIVHGEMARVIGALAQGQTPAGRASTAAVKPNPAADMGVIAGYEASCDALLAAAAAAPDPNTAARFAHPWFGPLSAAGWYALAGGHLGIHRVQLERIRAALAAGGGGGAWPVVARTGRTFAIPSLVGLGLSGFAGFVGAAPVAGRDPGTGPAPAAEAPAPASTGIRWPDRYRPERATFFVHNEIEIRASPRRVWDILIRAQDWPGWYGGASNVQVLPPAGDLLRGQAVFTWKTMGFDFRSEIREFVPPTRLSWESRRPDISGYHAWLIVPTPTGCRVVTEESQFGLLANLQKLFQPNKLRRLHDVWLSELKRRAEAGGGGSDRTPPGLPAEKPRPPRNRD